MDQLTWDEAKYEKEINDMEVEDIEDNKLSLSPLLSNPNAENPAPVVGDQNRATEKSAIIVGDQFETNTFVISPEILYVLCLSHPISSKASSIISLFCLRNLWSFETRDIYLCRCYFFHFVRQRE
ncbi:hypothetical protein Bca4012_037553 [Brassica carinata]